MMRHNADKNFMPMLATARKMTDDIHEPTSNFAFDHVTLTAPVAIAGGNHYMKYLVNGKPLYLQTPVCKVKGGVHLDICGNKRPFCDLMFTNENEAWIRWMEDLEVHTCRYMFERREKWFASDLDMADMENYFQSPLKIYKSGKFYLARTMVPVRLGKVTLKIYDDAEREIDPSTITEDTDVMTIIQVQGIKCSARSFQVELELKQMLVLSPTDVFQKCLLLGSRGKEVVDDSAATQPQQQQQPPPVVDAIQQKSSPTPTPTPPLEEEETETETNVKNNDDDVIDNDELLSFDVSLDESSLIEAVEIKPRNEVFFEMYKEARRKAKEARNVALAAYLEAKHIKNTYNIEIEEDDDDDDAFQEGLTK